MHFCDDEKSSLHKHNREAPNKHNAVCDTLSVWSVISRHADFTGNNNLPTNITNSKPTFNVVRVLNGARYVLVTDVSSSMGAFVCRLYRLNIYAVPFTLYNFLHHFMFMFCFQNRIERLYDAARRWIQYDIPDGTSLGIVKFRCAVG
jgi:hypothetical protein